MVIIGVILLILITISIFKLIIPQYGLQFLILKCPRCNKRGVLQKTGNFQPKKQLKWITMMKSSILKWFLAKKKFCHARNVTIEYLYIRKQ